MLILTVYVFIGILHTAIGKSTNYIFFFTKLSDFFLLYINSFNKIFMIFKPENWPPRYNWNIVESGVKHHNTNPEIYQSSIDYILKSNSLISTHFGKKINKNAVTVYVYK